MSQDSPQKHERNKEKRMAKEAQKDTNQAHLNILRACIGGELVNPVLGEREPRTEEKGPARRCIRLRLQLGEYQADLDQRPMQLDCRYNALPRPPNYHLPSLCSNVFPVSSASTSPSFDIAFDILNGKFIASFIVAHSLALDELQLHSIIVKLQYVKAKTSQFCSEYYVSRELGQLYHDSLSVAQNHDRVHYDLLTLELHTGVLRSSQKSDGNRIGSGRSEFSSDFDLTTYHRQIGRNLAQRR